MEMKGNTTYKEVKKLCQIISFYVVSLFDFNKTS